MSRLNTLIELNQKANGQDADLLYMIAMEYQKAGAYEDAIVWFDQTLDKDQAYHYAYYQKARSLDKTGESEEAAVVAKAGMVQAKKDHNSNAYAELEALLDLFDA